MPIYKTHISIPVDSNLPRDRMLITPHFNVSGAAPTALALATALADKMATWLTVATPIEVKVYTQDGGDSGPPLATYTKNPASPFLTTTTPREISLCLSYFSTANVKRQRGRLYIPANWIMKASSGSVLGQRPTASYQNSVALLADSVLKGVSASGAQWGFWSTVTASFRAVTDYWIDDEWDIQRKRGLRPTSRVTGTAP